MQITDYRLYPAIQAQPSECAKVLSSAQPFDRAAASLSGVDRVWTVGIGTSYNAAQAAAWMLRAAGLEARALTSLEFALWPPLDDGDAVLLFAHTGRKTYSGKTLEHCIERGVPTVVITKVETELDTDAFPPTVTVLHTTTQDPSSMYTVSHTTAMTAAAAIADQIVPGALGEIGEIPQALSEVLQLESVVEALAADWSEGALIALGAGPMLAAADEAQIKIAEASRRSIRHYEPESFLHGPQVQVSSDERILAFAANDAGQTRTAQITRFVHMLGCDAVWLAPASAAPPEGIERWLQLPELAPPLMPIAAAPPTQLLAGYLAAPAGIDADSFRTDDPVFAAALSELKL